MFARNIARVAKVGVRRYGDHHEGPHLTFESKNFSAPFIGAYLPRAPPHHSAISVIVEG